MNTQRTSVAIDWFMRLCEEDVSEGELSEWIQWCADADNLREFQGVRDTWRGFDRLGPAASELLETALLVDAAISPTTAIVSQPIQRRTRRFWPYAAAATILAAVLGALLYMHPFAWTQRAQISARAELKFATLPDGSTLTLAPRTNIAVDFSGPHRSLRFARGEAYFDVRPDKQKPFVVQTAGLKVTAIGTAFDIRSEEEQVTVTVQEGVVEVAHTEPQAAQPWRLAAGQRIVLNTRHKSANIEAVDLARALAWHQGRLEYFAAPLSEVVTDINRYSGRSIEIGDPQLARLAYTGSVFTQSVDDWLSAIQATFPVRVVVARDNHIVLLNR